MMYGKKNGQPFISISPFADLAEIRETFQKIFSKQGLTSEGPPPASGDRKVSSAQPASKKSASKLDFNLSLEAAKIESAQKSSLVDPLHRPPEVSSSAFSLAKDKSVLDPERSQMDETKGGSLLPRIEVDSNPQ